MSEFANILVVKIGGGAGLNLAWCADDLAELARQRLLVVVHGVSDRLNRLCAERGVEVRTLISPSGHSSRYTDPLTRDLFVEAARSVSAELRQSLAERGVRAAAIEGAILGQRKDAVRAVVDGRVRVIRDDYSGTITQVLPDPIAEALRAGLVPLLPPLASSPDGFLNVDGDRASAAVAASLRASELVILSNVRGLYRSWPDDSSLVARVPQSQLEAALSWAEGRMKRKVLGAQEALRGGVSRVIIGDGRQPQPIRAALSGQGTEFCP
ncbi:MAG: [LysW]-aminoadipate kinase [Anaerolineae bacterium]|nr:[LysW]-aminoadipate kinase [Anaerolineae bacterium]MDW8172739.1 [LysW]-aminoadipate kinase [Anaerolineae bacterium]